MMDILVIVALVFAGIIAHNMYNNHPTTDQMALLAQYSKTGKPPALKAVMGGGGRSGSTETAGTGVREWER